METTARKLVKGSSMRTISFAARLVVTFFMMPFVVFSLGDRMYGVWTLIGTFMGYYGVLDLGLSSAVNRHISSAIGAEDEKECNQIFNTALVIFSGLGIAALLITVAVTMIVPLFVDSPEDADLFRKVILILGVSMAIGFPLRAFSGTLVSQLRFDMISVIQIMTLVLRTTLIILVLTAGYKVLAMAWVTFFASIPETILTIYFSRKNLPSIRFNFKGSLLKAKELFSYSLYSFIAQVANQLRFHVSFIVIGAFLSLSMVTHYKVGSLMTTYFMQLMIAIVWVLMPFFSRLQGADNHEKIKKTFFFTTKISVCISSFVGFGLIFWGKPFIERWMGPEYLDAYPVLLILTMSCVVSMWQLPSVALLFGTARHKFFATINLAEGVLNLLLSLLLVRHFGMIGVALGAFIPMMLVMLVIQPIYVCRVLSIQYLDYVRRMARTLMVVCLSLAAPALISAHFATPDYIILLALGAACLCIYAFIIWVYEFNAHQKQIMLQALFPRLSLKKTEI